MTEPRSIDDPLLNPVDTPTLWQGYVNMLFIRTSDNTPCEQRVSDYRHTTHPNQVSQRP